MRKYTLADAKRDHPKWFSKGAMGFFGSRLYERRSTPTALYVVQSTTPPDPETVRTWSVIRFSPTTVDTCHEGIYPGLGSHRAADTLAWRLFQAEKTGLLRERENANAAFIACERCVDDGEEHPGWATFQYAGDHHLCSKHLGTIEHLGLVSR